MSRRLESTASIFVALLLVGTADAGPGRDSGTRTLRIPRPAMVAADGSTAAVATGCGPRVYWLYAWTPVRRSVVSMAPPHQRKCYFESTGDGVWEHGIAGKRIAWVAFTGGNLRQSWLVTATIGKPRSTTTLTGPLDRVTGNGVGDWVGNVHGDRSLLVFNTWSLCDPLDPANSCPKGTPRGDLHIYDEKVWRIVGRRKRLVLASSDEATVLSVASGRILLRRADGSLELRRADGSLIRSYAFRPGKVRGAVLDASELVVLDRGERLTWRVFDPLTGAERQSLPAPPRAVALDVERGLLVYSLGKVVHVLRLADGREKTYVASVILLESTVEGGAPLVQAQLEPSGLFYSYRVGSEGRVRFVPSRQIGLVVSLGGKGS
jgi:hypothetical protein